MLSEEAERCEMTGKVVIPGLLERCEISGRKVLPSELEHSAGPRYEGAQAIFHFEQRFGGARIPEQEAIRSMTGKYCAPQEAKMCLWSSLVNRVTPTRHPPCEVIPTGVPIHFKYSYVTNGHVRFEPLINLLNGVRRKMDKPELWDSITAKASDALKNNGKIEAAELSPDGNHLAVALEIKDWLGLRTRYAGLIFSIKDNAIDGHIVLGKRGSQNWILEKNARDG